MKRKMIALALALVLCASLGATAFADTQYRTVTFFTDASMTTVHETQQVAFAQHPTEPATVPASYTENGFRYEFDQWYWTVSGNPEAYSFTDDFCEVWSDQWVYAGYTQYLAKGYVLIIETDNDLVFITDTTTPIKEITPQFSNIKQVYVRDAAEYQHGVGGDLDANEDGDITPVDAAIFLSRKNYEFAAEVLRQVVEQT